MFKRQKPDSSLPRRPEATSSPVLPAQPAAEPFPRPSAAVLPMPGSSGSLPRPAGSPSAARTPMPGLDATSTLPPLPPMRSTVSAGDAARRDVTQQRTLVVGRGISVQGTVQDAERLVVEGTVEASMVQANELAVSTGGMFKGGAEVENAEIAGTIDGSLTVRGSLIVRATGKVLGTAHCHRLQVEDGGQINGRIEMLSEPVRSVTKEPAMEAAE